MLVAGGAQSTAELGWNGGTNELRARFDVDNLPLADGRFHVRLGLSDDSGIALVAFETGDAANAAVELMKVTPPQPEVMSIEGVEMGEVLAHD